MSHPRVCLTTPGLCLLLLIALPAWADDPPATPADSKHVTVRGTNDVNFPEIAVDFELHNPDGSAVLDATRDDFEVRESGQSVPVLSFEAPMTTIRHPTSVVLVVDTSGSMMEFEDRLTPMKQAAATFLSQMPEGSQVAVVAFSSSVRLIQPFTSDPEAVATAVRRLEAGGQTRFYDAVAQALSLLAEQPGRRAIVALTDGIDTASQWNAPEDVIDAARTAGIPVHTLGVGTEEEIAADELQMLASATRARYFPAREATALQDIYNEVARGLRESYTLTYRTDRNLPDGTFRPVEVVYRGQQTSVGTVDLFIRGMVVPATGWDRLFLSLLGGLVALALAPSLLAGRRSAGGPV